MILAFKKKFPNTVTHKCQALNRNPVDQSEITWYCAECDEIIYIQSEEKMRRVQKLTYQNAHINHYGATGDIIIGCNVDK